MLLFCDDDSNLDQSSRHRTKQLQLFLRHRIDSVRIDRNVIMCLWKASNVVAAAFCQLLRATLVAHPRLRRL